MIILTQAERDKFSGWLKQEAESDKLILQQMEKMDMSSSIVTLNKQRLVACIIVAGMLDSIEEQTI